jgi:hypothetical protein
MFFFGGLGGNSNYQLSLYSWHFGNTIYYLVLLRWVLRFDWFLDCRLIIVQTNLNDWELRNSGIIFRYLKN